MLVHENCSKRANYAIKFNRCVRIELYIGLISISRTVEPRHTTTPFIRAPRYYDHFSLARTKAHSFSYLKTPLIRPPRYYDQRPPLGVLSRYFRYKITPLIRPVKMLGGADE